MGRTIPAHCEIKESNMGEATPAHYETKNDCVWTLPWYQELMISIVHFKLFCLWFCIWLASDIKNFWYPYPNDITYLSDIMSPALRDGASWGRNGLGALPPPASPPSTNWGRVSSWTAKDLIQHMELWMSSESAGSGRSSCLSWELANFKFKLKHHTGTCRLKHHAGTNNQLYAVKIKVSQSVGQ